MRASLIFAAILALATLIVALPNFDQASAAAASVELVARAGEEALVNTEGAHLERRKKHKKNKHHKKKTWTVEDGIATWYDGDQLWNPSCGGSNPNDKSPVCAVSYASGIACHSTIELHYKGNSTTCIVRDHCADCPWNHVDLTTSMFGNLAALDEGKLYGVTYHVTTQ